MYTSGCPKNQNKCWNKIGLPPSWVNVSPKETIAGMKKLVPSKLSSVIIKHPTNKAGNANIARTVAVKIPQIVKGNLIKVMPLALNCKTVMM